jgi:small-conductance mechanosensitive channel
VERFSINRRLAATAIVFSLALSALAVAAAGQEPLRDGMSALLVEPSSQSAPLIFFNRQIIVFHARVLNREPQDRAAAALAALEDLVAQGITGPVAVRPLAGSAIVNVGVKGVLAVTPADIDELAGEQVNDVAAQVAERLRVALVEAVEGHTPRALIRSTIFAALLLVLGALALVGVARLHRVAAKKLVALAEQTVARTGIADVAVVRASRLFDVERRLVAVFASLLYLAVIYVVTGVVLRLFAYTRPWAEAMRGFFVNGVENAGLAIAQSIPGLLSVFLILVATRFISRVVALWFNAIEQGRIQPRWIYPETAQPTRRLFNALLWVFAIMIAYPYVPGSETEAFKGISVFLGLMFTFGSSGLVNQIMSGFMITYSRALRIGDFVRIGDVEGVVTHLGVLSTKVTTILQEEATIPNAVVVATTTTDYSRFSETRGVFTPTSVTIGYDTPWRQVHALLLLAAARTAGLKKEPQPRVLQSSLEDFYVKYTLFVCLERQESRLLVLGALHANIQDLFNEYGVQIMSPNYVLDPSGPKVVPKKDWFAAPASQNAELSTENSERKLET